MIAYDEDFVEGFYDWRCSGKIIWRCIINLIILIPVLLIYCALYYCFYAGWTGDGEV